MKDTLVIVHPDWPWAHADNECKSEKRRLAGYEEMLQRALDTYDDILLVGEIDEVWPIVLRRLSERARFIVPSSAETNFEVEAGTVARFSGGKTLVVGGFYRNLCVRQFCAKLERKGVSFRVEPTLCPRRFVY